MERLERRLFRLLERKTLIVEEDAVSLYEQYYRPFVAKVQDMERGFIDFYNVSADF